MKDVHGAQIKVKSKCPAKKVGPPCGELKSNKATKVTETKGGDVRGAQIKVKAKFPAKKVAPRGSCGGS